MYKHVQEKKEKVPTTSEMLEDYKKTKTQQAKKGNIMMTQLATFI